MKESQVTSPELAAPITSRRSVSIGVPASCSPAERRFPLTPEAAGMLAEQGYTVKIESGAAKCINYADTAYLRAGAVIVDRDEALRCDVVLHLAPLTRHDAMRLRRGALLMTLFHPSRQDAEALKVILGKSIVAVALDLMEDRRGNHPFADILAEIDGRASIAIASSLLADPARGKGILIGGIAGIVPCEVTILGSDLAAVSAARSALGLGAMVRMFDNDVYRLRDALHSLGPGVVGSALHPHVLEGALRSADIVVATSLAPGIEFGSEIVSIMKRGVIAFDLAHGERAAFPSLPTVDLASASLGGHETEPGRVCYINAGNAVPRTAAMALSNTFTAVFSDIMACDGITNALKIMPGLRQAVFTYLGRPVNRRTAQTLGMKYVDINFFLQFS